MSKRITRKTKREVVKHYNTGESTVRKTAEKFDISKSSVHNILTKDMRNTKSLEILEKNRDESHIRGGEATRQKYLKGRS